MSGRDSKDFNSETLRNLLKTSTSPIKSNFTADDQQINELANLLGSINESDAPRLTTSTLNSRRSYLPTGNSTTSGGVSATTLPLRSSVATVGTSASSLLQKALDRNVTSDVRESRETRFSSTTLPSDSERRFTIQATTSSLPLATAPVSDSDSDRNLWRNRGSVYSTSQTSTTTSNINNNPNSNNNASPVLQDTIDHTVIRFNTEYSLRTKQGRYLQTIAEDVQERDDTSVATFASDALSTKSLKTQTPHPYVYLLGADGQGIGALTDALQFVNLEQKDSSAPLMYGATVAIKSSAAKERLLGIKDGSRIGFWRHFIGEGEKWVITRAIGQSPLTGCHGVTVPVASLGIEDVSARNTRYVRLGDHILLQTKKSEHYLSVQDAISVTGAHDTPTSSSEQIKLIYKERGGLLGAQEAFQLESFGTVPLPRWLTSRPYLSKQMLTLPASFIQPSVECETRVFGTAHLPPHHHLQHIYQSQKSQEANNKVLKERMKLPSLGSYSVAEQQRVLLRDILCLCAGVNGTYLRAVNTHASSSHAPNNNNQNTNNNSNNTSNNSNNNIVTPALYSPNNWGLITDMQYAFIHRHPSDTYQNTVNNTPWEENDLLTGVDASVLHQISELLPFFTMVLHLRDFIAKHSEFDYGLVSHAFVKALRKLMTDFDVLVCQLEHLFNAEKLTLQKLLFFLQPSRRMMLVLYRVCFGHDVLHTAVSGQNTTSHHSQGARHLVGGQLLQHLCQSLQAQGDDQAKQLLHMLVSETAEPFLTMISQWIYRGELQDPYREFMIAEDINVKKEALQADFNAQYWDHRYTLRVSHIPTGLISMEIAQKILMTGKYLNVVRDCVGDAMLSAQQQNINNTNTNEELSISRFASTVPTSPKKSTSNNNKQGSNRYNTAMKIVLPVAKKLTVNLNNLLSSYSDKNTTNNHNNNKHMRKSQNKHSYRVSEVDSDSNEEDNEFDEDYDEEEDNEEVFSEEEDKNNNERISSLLPAIESTYRYASQTLLYLLDSRYGLHLHLQSLGRFFLLANGDFFIQFMDLAEEELRREVPDITLSRLRHLLSMAVQTSTVAQDVHREALSCTLAPHTLIQHLQLIQMAGELTALPSTSTLHSVQSQAQYASLLAQPTQGLKGIEALQLDYQVAWPASIVFSRRAITKYQLLSRLLYFSKHVERRLLHAWQGQQYTRIFTRQHVTQAPLMMIMRVSYTLRHKMLHFIQNFVYYMTLEVIHPRVTQLEQDVCQVTDMDRLLEIHEKFLDGCLRECLLASPELLKVLTKLMTTALLFADHMVQVMDMVQRVSVSATHMTRLSPNMNNQSYNKGETTAFTVSLEKKRSQRGTFTDTNSNNNNDENGTSNNKVDPMALARHRQMMQQRTSRIALQGNMLHQEMNHEACQRVLLKFANTFDGQLKDLLEGLWNNAYRQHAQLANLCVRLDYNEFYSNEFSN